VKPTTTSDQKKPADVLKHTPGPWKLATHLGDPCTVYIERGQDDEPGICTTDGADFVPVDSEEEQEANARLIAAAPDMLAALKSAQASLRAWNTMGLSGPSAKQVAAAYENSPEMKAISAAIAKAERGQ
jgi:hypothetical protein